MPTTTSLQHGVLLRLARAHHKRAETEGDCLVVVVLAALALEAFVNDLENCAPELGSTPFGATLGTALARADEAGASATLKIDIAHLVMTGTMANRGHRPYQDIELLMKLRNSLVHARPEAVSYGDVPDGLEIPKIVRTFASRALIPLPPAGARVGWREYVLVPPVAGWAIETVEATIRWLAAVCPDHSLKMLLKMFVAEPGSSDWDELIRTWDAEASRPPDEH